MQELMSNLIQCSKTVWRYETPCITQNTILNTSCTFPDKTRIACAISVFLRSIGKQIEKILWQITCIQILWEVVIPDIQSNLPKFLKILPQHIVCFENPENKIPECKRNCIWTCTYLNRNNYILVVLIEASVWNTHINVCCTMCFKYVLQCLKMIISYFEIYWRRAIL